MGFFLTPEEKAAAAPQRTKAVRTPKAARVLDPNQRGCDHCDLKDEWPRLLNPKMQLVGPSNADILILGEAPGENEDAQGAPFVGDAGKILRDVIPRRFRERIAWQNTVRCRPPENETPSNLQMHACSVHLEDDLRRLRKTLKAIIGVGGIPLRRFFSNEAKITEAHGRKFPIDIDGKVVWYFPVLHTSYLLRTGGTDSFAYPVFKNDMELFFKEVDRWPEPSITNFELDKIVCSFDPEEVEALIERMREPLGFDIETTTLRPYQPNAKVITAAFSDGETTVAFPVNHPEAKEHDWGWKIIERYCSTRQWIAHNAPMELSWLWWKFGWGWRLPTIDDTMCAGRVVAQRESMQSLASMSRFWLGVDVKKLSPVDARRIMNFPLNLVLPYNGLDAQACALLWRKLDRSLNYTTRNQYKRLRNTNYSCTAMELAGLPKDQQAIEGFNNEYKQKMDSFEEKARNVYEVRQFQLKYGDFNIASGDHVGLALVEFGKVSLPKTKKGEGKKLSTEDSTLEKIAEANPLARIVQDWREYQKLHSTYIDPLINKHIATDGLIHPSYTVCHTATLRLSCQDPNAQNYPARKHKEIRRVVPAKLPHLAWGEKTIPLDFEKVVIVKFDYGQLQARIMAMASRDKALCRAIISEYDIHADWRDRLLNHWPDYLEYVKHRSGLEEEKALLKAGRNNIKSDFVFASLFGASAKSCAERIGAPLMIMTKLQEEFWEEFSGVRKFLRDMRVEYKATGGVSFLTGMRRYGLFMGNESINSPIQNGEAEIVMSAQNELFELAYERNDPWLMPRISLHDDLTFFLPDDDRLCGYIETIAKIMTKPRFDWIIVPLTVECCIGSNWADFDEVAKFTGNYHR